MTRRTSRELAALPPRLLQEPPHEARHAPQHGRLELRDRVERLVERVAHLELGMRRAGQSMHHRQAGDHGRADDAQKRAGREIRQRIEIGDAVVRPEALGLVAAAGLVPDRIGVVGGVVERRWPAAGGAGRVGDVPQHALGRREVIGQIGGLQAERLGIGDVVVLARRRQLCQIAERTDAVRRDPPLAKARPVERMRQRNRAQRPPQPFGLNGCEIRHDRSPPKSFPPP